jgi:hypothetical protein
MKRTIGLLVLLLTLGMPLPAVAQNDVLLQQLMDAWYEYQVLPMLRPVCSNDALVHHREIVRLTVLMMQSGIMDLPRMQQEGVELKRTASPQCLGAMNSVSPPKPSGTCMGGVCCTSSGCTH